ncbi:hypothetical protein DZC72_15445 [Maribacter algicola]|uniref:Uncharacterized protein n=1 Tax=Maribacter algicola TaxID=2498892 RepID=A0A3R8RKJ6_9FLAO|nr:hypothetical protein DZC72_15445 [Maribacter algicola]
MNFKINSFQNNSKILLLYSNVTYFCFVFYFGKNGTDIINIYSVLFFPPNSIQKLFQKWKFHQNMSQFR